MRGKLRDKGSINKRDPFHNNAGEQRRPYKRGPRTADWIDQQLAQLDEEEGEEEEEESLEEPASEEQLEIEPAVKIVAKK
ncbi:hypothetical protein [Dictyobacter arantiisoli]|uniref:Uncharacterized protein n=1 Tax=Dictyobacter arantiisoli TaxID=2014874 RepID=A0A5A5TCD3_9CHLR|nr:hypothetical protein [Dictyobacter arantiisoli]GCF08604.1 hypothetical protein KDI_21680 [Dictyobacter arantiisoli]